jgi:two-component system response regulator CpxR
MRPRKTILCVEDNEQLLSVRKFLLETRGYRVLAMNSAAEALEYLQDATPGSVDLLLSDLIMPGMDGNELIRRAKQLMPGLPALLVSGTVTSFDRAAAADAFLPKGACAPAEVLDQARAEEAGPVGRRRRWSAAGRDGELSRSL